jgi:deoxyribonuclease-4
MERRLLFGTAGIPLSTAEKTNENGIREVKKLGLGCMEIEFVRGVNMSNEKALMIRKVAESLGVILTVHAPYFINLSSSEPAKVIASKQRILSSARVGAMAGAESVTFHPAYYGSKPSNEVYEVVKAALSEIVETLRAEQINIDIRPETTGKASQFGTIDELLTLSNEVSGIKPCVDFAHIYARSVGKFNSYAEFMSILDKVESYLGANALKDMHIHLSNIQYGDKGEQKHLIIQDEDCEFKYKELLKALYDREVCGVLVCESPNLETDALLFKKIYAEFGER